MLSYPLCNSFPAISYALTVTVCVASVCGHWVVDLLDYFIMKYPYYSYLYNVSSIITTSCKMFVNFFISYMYDELLFQHLVFSGTY